MTNTDGEGRVLVGPKVRFSTPWRVAEMRGAHTIVVCSDGHYVAEVPDGDLAALIVEAVNEKYGEQQHP